jgi:hypothetical protein
MANPLSDTEIIDWSRSVLSKQLSINPNFNKVVVEYRTPPDLYSKDVTYQHASVTWTNINGEWQAEVGHVAPEKDFDTNFYGSEYVRRKTGFKNELDKIEDRHREYFQSRPGHLQDQKHDQLSNHWLMTYDGRGRATFGFRDSSDLRQDIQEECKSAFLKWFTVPADE